MIAPKVLMAEREGFEAGHFAAPFAINEIAENPCKHWYLSTSRLSPVSQISLRLTIFSTFWN
jgi:hypothetical protein